jgi:serine/threonine protein phosphatase 1
MFPTSRCDKAEGWMEDFLTYAIGDVHGCFDKLVRLLGRCRLHCRARPMRLVFVGDYVDRGPQSRRVVELLIETQAAAPDRVICLRGNHEAMAVAAAMQGGQVEALWLINGAAVTLQSYGVARAAALPAQHLEWFRSLPCSYDDGRRHFVHAGVDPRVPLTQQSEEDQLWIREPFLSHRGDYGRLIVHGHTPLPGGRPDLRSNRLNIDTGAVFGGPLTAAVFDMTQTEPIEFFNEAD